MRIVQKLTGLYCLLGATVLGVYGTLTIERERAMFERTVRDDALLTAATLGSALERLWSAEGPLAVDAALRQGPEGAGRLLLRLAPVGSLGLSPGARADLAAGLAVARAPADEPGFVEVLQPLSVPGDAVLVLRESLGRERDYLRRSKVLVAGAAGALLGALGLASFVIGRQLVGRPVRELVDKARRVGAGDLGGPVRGLQGDEIGELGRAMNEMCRQLEGEIQARLQAQSELRHAERLKLVGQLAAGVAHELGTPLNIVLGRADMLAEDEAAPREVREAARVIVGQIERISEIVRQLLDFGRRGERQPRRLDLAELVEESLDLLRPLARAREVTLRLDLEGARPTWLLGDAEHLRQALTNVVVNGLQAMAGGGELQVSLSHVSGQPPGSATQVPCAALAIQDTGGGIAAEDLERVFEPFYTTKAIGEGTGLGLSVAHGVVSDHGGWITVRSEVGRGSCFMIYLPLPREDLA